MQLLSTYRTYRFFFLQKVFYRFPYSFFLLRFQLWLMMYWVLWPLFQILLLIILPTLTPSFLCVCDITNILKFQRFCRFPLPLYFHMTKIAYKSVCICFCVIFPSSGHDRLPFHIPSSLCCSLCYPIWSCILSCSYFHGKNTGCLLLHSILYQRCQIFTWMFWYRMWIKASPLSIMPYPHRILYTIRLFDCSFLLLLWFYLLTEDMFSLALLPLSLHPSDTLSSFLFFVQGLSFWRLR